MPSTVRTLAQHRAMSLNEDSVRREVQEQLDRLGDMHTLEALSVLAATVCHLAYSVTGSADLVTAYIDRVESYRDGPKDAAESSAP